jgi:hypothetical protein
MVWRLPFVHEKLKTCFVHARPQVEQAAPALPAVLVGNEPPPRLAQHLDPSGPHAYIASGRCSGSNSRACFCFRAFARFFAFSRSRRASFSAVALPSAARASHHKTKRRLNAITSPLSHLSSTVGSCAVLLGGSANGLSQKGAVGQRRQGRLLVGKEEEEGVPVLLDQGNLRGGQFARRGDEELAGLGAEGKAGAAQVGEEDGWGHDSSSSLAT